MTPTRTAISPVVPLDVTREVTIAAAKGAGCTGFGARLIELALNFAPPRG